jgi:D-lyxose ketol-isomerase
MTRAEGDHYRHLALPCFERAGIYLTAAERAGLEVALGLGDFETTGLVLHTYVDTERVCAKEPVLLPHQTCPQHKHPPVGSDPGKEETFRLRWGRVRSPEERWGSCTVLHEVVLARGEQYTLPPDTWHWFQAVPKGAVVGELSTRSRDGKGLLTDPEIRRLPELDG